jgi:hypothetical protein
MNRVTVYFAANLIFDLLLAIGMAEQSRSGVHILYLAPLFALCSSPLIEMRQLNGRYALLGIFSAAYFVFFGLTEFFDVLSGNPSVEAAHGAISAGEFVILVGAALVQLGNRLSVRLTPEAAAAAAPSQQPKDWPELSVVLVGGLLWAVTTWLSWRFKIHIVIDTSIENQAIGLASVSGLTIAAYVLAAYLQPLSILILAYAQCKYRRFYMIPVLFGVVIVQFIMGFIEDSKGDALIGMLIVMLTKLLVDARLPTRWLLAGMVFIAFAWPMMQANRTVRNQNDWNRVDVEQHLGRTLVEVLAAKHDVMSGADRAQSFFERLSLKGSVEMIVDRTGRDVRYQNGYTLSPILSTFIPRLLWSAKPDVPTGRIMNREFQLGDQEETYISPSHIGELYWNFGWPGVLFGMSLFGLMLGFLGARLDLSTAVTLTRLLILVATLDLLVRGFESSIASQYVVWMRCLVAIGLLHAVLARIPVARTASSTAGPAEVPAAGAGARPAFANLMR